MVWKDLIMKKNAKLHITLTSEQKRIIERRAYECGLNLSNYCVYLLLNVTPSVDYINDRKKDT